MASKRRATGGDPSRTGARRLIAADAQKQAMEMRLKGCSLDEVAEALGYANRSGAYKAVMAGLEAMLREPAEKLREQEQERLDRMQRAIWDRAMGGQVVKQVDPETGEEKDFVMPPNLEAQDRLLKIMERRARLVGLDAPKVIKQKISGEEGAPPVQIQGVVNVTSLDLPVETKRAILEAFRAKKAGQSPPAAEQEESRSGNHVDQGPAPG